ncbi:MAG: DUF4249 family protein [Bacteroidia bacterium]|nr:DUF4249 family protein [Bacteroidia bacterium]
MARSGYIAAALALMLPTLWLTGCIEEISLDTGEASRVVVNCLLKEGDVQTMELYYTSEARDGVRRPVTDAEVILSSYDEEVSRFRYDSGCVWSARFTPKHCKLYKLKVITGGDTLSAQTRFPDDVDVASYFKGRYSDTSHHHTYLFVSYELRYISDTIFIYDWTTSEQIDFAVTYGKSYPSACKMWVFPRDLGRGDHERYIGTTHALADDFNLSSLFVSDLPCFSRDSILAMDSQTTRRVVEWYPVLYPGLQLHDGFVRIPIKTNYQLNKSQKEVTDTPLNSPRAFVLVRDIPTSFTHPIHSNALLKAELYDFYFLSNEADSYFKDVYSRKINKDNFVFEYETDNVYSNIEGGGLGVFGAIIMRTNRKAIKGYYNDSSPDFVYSDD